MAPTNPTFERIPATIVSVDVTAHKEERHITDVKKSGKKSNTRVRYYVELIVGPRRESHTRLGFSGTFKALLRLHGAFETIFNAKHAPLKTAHASSRESMYSVTSASSGSSSSSASRRRTASIPMPFTGIDGDGLPKILPFPTSHALLVKLQPRHAESDDKSRARCDDLFAYYTALLNSDERELYLDYIQGNAERQLANENGNQQEETLEPTQTVGGGDTTRRASGFFKKLFSRCEPTSADSTSAAGTSQRQRASALDAKLEFVAPVHVHKKKATSRRQ